MRKKISVDFGLFITGGMIFWIILSTWNYCKEITLIEEVSNGMMTNSAVYFQTAAEILDYQEIYSCLPEHGILYNDLSWDKNQKGIAFKEDMPDVPILSGRFFAQGDTENKVAVAGKNIVKEWDTDCTIDVNGIDYEVIGIMGVEYDTKLDDTIWVLLNEENLNVSSTFTLDGLNEQTALSYLGKQELWSDIRILDRENIGILEAIDQKDDYWIFPLMVIWVGWSYSLVLLNRWLQIHMNEIHVRKELGYSFRSIKCTLVRKSFMPYGLGIIAAYILSIFAGMSHIRVAIIPLLVSVVLFILLWTGAVFCSKKIRSALGIGRNGSNNSVLE